MPNLLPLASSATRFAEELLQGERTLLLYPALDFLHDQITAGTPVFLSADARTVKQSEDEFKALFIELRREKAELEGIKCLADIVTPIIALAGSETQFTASLPVPSVLRMWTASGRVAASQVHLSDMMYAFQSGLLQRLLPHRLAHLYDPTKHSARVPECPPDLLPGATAAERDSHTRKKALWLRRIRIDEQNNAASFLDAASNFLANGGVKADAVTTLYHFIIGCAKELGAGADAAAPAVPPVDSNAEFNARVKEVETAPKPAHIFLSDPQWRESCMDKAAAMKKERAAARRKNLPSNYALQGLRPDNPLGTGRDDDPMLPLLNQLFAEAHIMESVHKAEFDRATSGGPYVVSPYGDVFTPDNALRYEFWPARASQMPLLAFCARHLLTARIASTTNERTHSPAERITSKVRARLRPARVELLTLSGINVRAEALEIEQAWQVSVAAKSAAERENALELVLTNLGKQMAEASLSIALDEEAAPDEEVEEVMIMVDHAGEGAAGGGADGDAEEEEGEEAQPSIWADAPEFS
jgi:hypothetical protein